jgi:hypothetical protein
MRINELELMAASPINQNMSIKLSIFYAVAANQRPPQDIA